MAAPRAASPPAPRAPTNTGARWGGSTMSMATATWCVRVRRSVTTQRRRSREFRWRANPTQGGGLVVAPIIARDALALARILVGRCYTVANVRALLVVLNAYVSTVLPALDAFILGNSNAHQIYEEYGSQCDCMSRNARIAVKDIGCTPGNLKIP